MDYPKTPYKVIFQKSIGKHPASGEIIIYAVPSTWNDFKFKIRCGFECLSGDGMYTHTGEMLIGLLPPKDLERLEKEEFHSEYYSLHDAIDKLMHLSEYPKKNQIRFFTMLPSMNAYRKLVDSLGPKNAQQILESVNDLVYYKDKKTDWFLDAISSKVFSLGFMRNSEPFFAYNNAESILDGVAEEKFTGISQKLNLKFSLEGFKNDHEIELNYDSESCIPKRINILIGKNGLGKSQALQAFCRAALRYQDKIISLTDKKSRDRPMINRLLAIATPGETQNTFPSERRKTQKLYYRRLNLTRNSRTKTTRSINELLVQLVRSDEQIAVSDRWNLFKKSLSTVLHFENIVITLKDNGVIPIDYLRGQGGESDTLTLWSNVDLNSDPKMRHSEKLYPLSSGQLTFFKFALLCCLYIENGSFVLLDEPETHMHPNMISDFIDLLDSLLEETGSLALIATHSAYLVREVAQDQVHVFKRNENRINIVQPRLTTFGAPVDSISRFVFGDESDSSLTTKLYNKIQARNLSFYEVVEEFSDSISLAALMDIRRRMEV